MAVTLLLGACASGHAARSHAYSVPASVRTVHVGSFGSNPFAREMHDAIVEALAKTPRFVVAASADSADALLAGGFNVVAPNPSLQRTSPTGTVALASRAAGKVIWQYQYRDMSTGAEMSKPTQLRQVRDMARQFVEQLVLVTAPAPAATSRP